MPILGELAHGVDVGAKEVGILMIPSDLEEVIGVADRVVVMRDGAVAGTPERDAVTEHAVLSLAVKAERNT